MNLLYVFYVPFTFTVKFNKMLNAELFQLSQKLIFIDTSKHLKTSVRTDEFDWPI